MNKQAFRKALKFDAQLNVHITKGKTFHPSFPYTLILCMNMYPFLVCRWIDGSPVDYINWDEGGPDDTAQRCVTMSV